MSTTEDDTTDAPTPDHEQLPDAVNAERLQRDRDRYGEYRSLMRLSPSNEAESCETVAEVRAAISREAARQQPREWVLALLDERLAEVPDAE
jgi:hypothetical protein